MINNKEWEILLSTNFSEISKESMMFISAFIYICLIYKVPENYYNSIKSTVNSALNLTEESSKKDLYLKASRLYTKINLQYYSF